jgi:hypothetical protein
VKAATIWIACLAAGLGLGRWAAPSQSAPQVTDDKSPNTSAPTAISNPSEIRQPGIKPLIDALSKREATLARGDFASQLEQTGDPLARNATLTRWAKEDPAAMWLWVQDNAYPKWSPGTLAGNYDLFGQWMRQDPAAAAAALAETSDVQAIGSVQTSVIDILSGDDEAAKARILGHLDKLLPGPIWPRRDRGNRVPGASDLNAIQALPESKVRAKLLRQLLRDWYATDWQGAVDWAGKLPASDHEIAHRALVDSGPPWQVTHREPATIPDYADWLARSAPGQVRMLHTRPLVQRWAKRDAPAARQWVAENTAGATRHLLEAEIARLTETGRGQ